MAKIWMTAEGEGRVELGEPFADRLVYVQILRETEALVQIPGSDDPEARFYGPEARALIHEGIDAARAGDLQKGPDFSLANAIDGGETRVGNSRVAGRCGWRRDNDTGSSRLQRFAYRTDAGFATEKNTPDLKSAAEE